MSAFEEQPVVGLFGTCGASTFRKDLFIPRYEQLGIPYFNPQVDDWRPELADIESDHLTYDVVQIWPVLGITYGAGSLAEQGYSIASSMRAPSPLPKFIIPYIETELDESLTDEVARKESLRARKLAVTHMSNNESPNVFVVSSLDEMLETSVTLFSAAVALTELCKAKTPAYQRFVEGRRERDAFRQAMEQGLLGTDAAKLTAK